MSNIAFVTDSTANIPDAIMEREQITMVPVYVIFGEDSQKDYTEIPPSEFYRRLVETKAAGGTMPTTSQPTPEDFRTAYDSLKEQGCTDIISLHVTAKSSGTCQSAELARTMVEGVNVHVVDSATTSLLMAFMIFEAKQAIAAGGGVPEALEAIERVKNNSCLVFTVTDVEHLTSSGRTEGHEEAARSAISVKPIVAVDEGVPKAVGKERTQRAALKSVLEMAKGKMAGGTVKRMAVVNGNIQERAESWAPEAARALGYDGDPYVVDFGPALAVHFGPGLLGVAVEWE